ncbi:MAG: hypothetical protein MUE40_09425 [Anaerolineae bacterium]|jgi:hypothetical protein|nr:hypothetical protein [Anaerolineae bacterium]
MTPDTTAYMLLGLIVTFGSVGLYVASLFYRSSNLKQDAALLDKLKNDDQARA